MNYDQSKIRDEKNCKLGKWHKLKNVWKGRFIEQ